MSNYKLIGIMLWVVNLDLKMICFIIYVRFFLHNLCSLSFLIVCTCKSLNLLVYTVSKENTLKEYTNKLIEDKKEIIYLLL